MTEGAAKMSETDAVIFPVTFGLKQTKTDNAQIENENTTVDETSNKTDLKGRFARLKKSLRKRSVSIL
jgi:hemerythrin-like domain-containing protein